MNLKKVEIINYKNFENIVIDFEKNDFSNVYSIASENGGGKSTLLQFIFITLHCFMDEERHIYMKNILKEFSETTEEMKLIKFIIEENKEEYFLNFINSFHIEFNTNMSDEQLIKLSNSVYLIVPQAQPLYFLPEDYNDGDMRQIRENLLNFSNYEFSIEQSILNSFEHEKQEDFREMRVHGQYGSNYIDFTNELKDFIEGKEIIENSEEAKSIKERILELEGINSSFFRRIEFYKKMNKR